MNSLILAGAMLLLMVPIAVPFAALIPKLNNFGVPKHIIQRYVVASIVVTFISAAYLLGISFQSDIIKFAFIFFAAACYLSLMWLVFQIKPRLLGATLGFVIVVASVILATISGLAFVMNDKTNRIKLTSNLYCDVYQFGFAGNQGGLDVSLYRYLGLGISYRLIHDSYLDEVKHPFNTQEGACKFTMTKING